MLSKINNLIICLSLLHLQLFMNPCFQNNKKIDSAVQESEKFKTLRIAEKQQEHDFIVKKLEQAQKK